MRGHRRAWEELLLEHRDQMESTQQAAFVRCDSAYLRLSAAQRGGDPQQIAVAHAMLQQALEVARKRSIADDRIRRALLVELGLLTRPERESTVPALADQTGQGGSAATVRSPRRRPAPWLRHAIKRRTTDRRQP
jgi:hypothetical protein